MFPCRLCPILPVHPGPPKRLCLTRAHVYSGSFATFDQAACQEKLNATVPVFATKQSVVENYAWYRGAAANLFCLDLTQDAVPGYPVKQAAVRSFRDNHLKEGQIFRWTEPVTVVCSDCSGPGPAGKWRKATMDVAIFAVLEELWARVLHEHDNNKNPDYKKCAGSLWDAVRHVPMNFVYVPAAADFELQVFLLSVQVVEDININSEAHAVNGWRMCEYFAKGRAMTQTSNAEAVDDVDAHLATAEAFQRIKYAPNSEYAVLDAKSSRKVADGLSVYDRVVAAGAQDVIEEGLARMGPSGPLASFSKLVKINQQVYQSAKMLGEDPALMLRRTLEIFVARCRRKICESDMGLNCLQKTELPISTLLARILPAGAAEVPPITTPEACPRATEMMAQLVLSPGLVIIDSLKEALKEPVESPVAAYLGWVIALLEGKREQVLTEIVHGNFKKTPVKELLGHAKLNFHDIRAKVVLHTEQKLREATD